MSTERSDNLFFHHRAASEKFDYFVTGITGALCAYISQTYTPTKLSISPGTLELVALLILIGSVIAGFKRIEATISVYKGNEQLLRFQEERGQLVTKSSENNLVNSSTGETWTPEMVEAKIKILTEAIPKYQKEVEDIADKTNSWYTRRNYLLVIGFLALVASKVWVAYV